MKIIVNKTEKELTAIGKNDAEWTQDLLGGHGALHYDEETETFAMTEEEYEWWLPMVNMLNEVYKLEQELDPETYETYLKEDFHGDLETKTTDRLAWLKTHNTNQ